MSSILSIGVSALLTNRQAMDTTGHNIANVNTEGYSRQRVDFATRTPQQTSVGLVGSGVKTAQIARQYDEFLATQVRSSQSATSEHEAYYVGARRMDSLLADDTVGLSPAVQEFFNALQGLADDPTSIPARQVVLSEAESLADRFHYLDRQFETSRGEVNDKIDFAASEINRIGEALANVNGQIVAAYGTSSASLPNDLLDQRDQLLNDLSQLVDLQALEQSDGAVNVFIGKGQALVMGTTSATVSTAPSATDASQKDVVFTNEFGTQVITDQLSGGEISGHLRFRDEILNPAQNRLGLVAMGIATQFNTQHSLGIDLDRLSGSALFSPGTIQVLANRTNIGGSVTAAHVDVNNLTGSDYELEYQGSNQYSLTRLQDDHRITIDTAGASPYTTAEIDGFALTIDSTGVLQGDAFLVRPTRTAADEFQLLIHDTRRLAAASPLASQPAVDANGNPANTGSASITQPAISNTNGLPLAVDMELRFDPDAGGAGVPGFLISNGPTAPAYIEYDPVSDAAGKTFPDVANSTQFDAFGGMQFSISGIPDPGDRLLINNNTGMSDNRNALAMGELQNLNTLLNGNATFEESYSQMVSDIGAKTHHAEVNLAAQEGLLERSKAALDEVSGVNLDEEAAKLMQYQQAYQASAQMISVASTVFDTLLAAFRG